MTSWESMADDIRDERQADADAKARAREWERKRLDKQRQRASDFHNMIVQFVEAAAGAGNPKATGWRSKKSWVFYPEVPGGDRLEVFVSGNWTLSETHLSTEPGGPHYRAIMGCKGNEVWCRDNEQVRDWWDDRKEAVQRVLTTFMIDHGIPLPTD